MVQSTMVMDQKSSRQSTEDLEKEIEELQKKAMQQQEPVEIPDEPLDVTPEPADEEEDNFESAAPKRKNKKKSDSDDTEDSPKNEQNHDWKKRFGDLRRRHQEDVHELKELKMRLEALEASEGNPSNVQTEKDLEQFIQTYPDFAKVLEGFISQRLNAIDPDIQKKIKRIDDLDKDIKTRTLMSNVAKTFPNIKEIRDSEDFAYWYDEQAAKIYKDALSNPDPDLGSVNAAFAEFVRVYPEYAETAQKKRSKISTDDASDVPVRNSGNKMPTNRKKPMYSESMVRAMSDADYEKHMDAIDKARSSGNFLYDITGATPPSE